MRLHQFSVILGEHPPETGIVDLMFEVGDQSFRHVRMSLYEYIHDNPERTAAVKELLGHLTAQGERA